MVKDCWDQSSITVLSQTTAHPTDHKYSTEVLEQVASMETQKTAQTKDTLNNNNVWGCFISRENFIEMHIC